MKTKKCQWPGGCNRRVNQQEWKTPQEKALCLKHFVRMQMTKAFNETMDSLTE
jgi:hypothetical protein